jgi:hypothetical protein
LLKEEAGNNSESFWIADVPHFLIVFATPHSESGDDDSNADDHGEVPGKFERLHSSSSFHAHIG